MFKSTKWSHGVLTVTAAIPLADLIISVKNATSVSGKVSLIKPFSYRGLSKTSLDAERLALFVSMWTMIYFVFFAKDWIYMIIEIIHSSSGEFPYSSVMLYR